MTPLSLLARTIVGLALTHLQSQAQSAYAPYTFTTLAANAYCHAPVFTMWSSPLSREPFGFPFVTIAGTIFRMKANKPQTYH